MQKTGWNTASPRRSGGAVYSNICHWFNATQLQKVSSTELSNYTFFSPFFHWKNPWEDMCTCASWSTAACIRTNKTWTALVNNSHLSFSITVVHAANILHTWMHMETLCRENELGISTFCLLHLLLRLNNDKRSRTRTIKVNQIQNRHLPSVPYC